MAGVVGHGTFGGPGVIGNHSSGSRTGIGVSGVTDVGTGVSASAVHSDGTALKVAGRAEFSTIGDATVKGTKTSAKTSVKVSKVALTASSMILATLQDHLAGVAVAAAVPDVTAKSFTIYLTAAVKTSVKIAWFIIG